MKRFLIVCTLVLGCGAESLEETGETEEQRQPLLCTFNPDVYSACGDALLWSCSCEDGDEHRLPDNMTCEPYNSGFCQDSGGGFDVQLWCCS